MGHARATELKNAILKSMGKEDDPIGILVEAVLERELTSYDELLEDCLTFVSHNTEYSNELNELCIKIRKKIGKEI